MTLARGLAALAFVFTAGHAPAAAGNWNFRVLLDGKPIGQHRFAVTGDEARVQAAFDVKVLGFTAYRYRLETTEQWRGDCLAGLTARTDDDGKLSDVRAVQKDGRLVITSPKAEQAVEGCVMTFAYWNPAILKQSKLLDPQTGALQNVQVRSLGDEQIESRGKAVPARRYRISGPEQPIDLWYSPQGDWLALESTVGGGRKLSYRLE